MRCLKIFHKERDIKMDLKFSAVTENGLKAGVNIEHDSVQFLPENYYCFRKSRKWALK